MDKEHLKLMQDLNMYPPRLDMTVQMKPNVLDYRLQLQFQGCLEEGSLDMEVMLPLGNICTTIQGFVMTNIISDHTCIHHEILLFHSTLWNNAIVIA